MDNEMIINFVRECPWLFDASRDDFRDTEKKENSWRKLADILHVDVADVKKRWKSLRSAFVREKKLLPSGSAGGKKKWIYMDALGFLHPYVREKKQTYSNYGEELSHIDSSQMESSATIDYSMTIDEVFAHEAEENETMIQSTPQSSAPAPDLYLQNQTPQGANSTDFLTRRIKRKRHNEKILQSINKTDDMLNKICAEDDDGDELFCRSLKSHFKQIPDEYKVDVQIKILSVMKGEIEKIKNKH